MTDSDFTQKVHAYKNMIFRLAMVYLKNVQDAEDVTQDVFIKLYKQKKEFRSTEEEKAWLIRVTINASKDVLKSAWLRRTVPIDEDIPFEQEEQSDLFYAVHRLEPKYRIVMHLYYYEDYSVKEIAKALGIRETAIQTRLYRARKQLEKLLSNDASDIKSSKLKEGLYETGI